jgi:hypothetical protein
MQEEKRKFKNRILAKNRKDAAPRASASLHVCNIA